MFEEIFVKVIGVIFHISCGTCSIFFIKMGSTSTTSIFLYPTFLMVKVEWFA